MGLWQDFLMGWMSMAVHALHRAVGGLKRSRRRPVNAGQTAFVLLVLMLLLAGVACTSGDAAGSSPTPAPTADLSLPSGGVLWLGAGRSEGKMNLYRVPADGGRVEQLTSLPGGRGISEIAAGSGRVMVAAAPAGHDQIYEVLDGQLELFIEGRVFSPALSADGQLAYLRMLDPAHPGESDFAVLARDLNTGEERVVYQSEVPSGPQWGPDGQLAVLEQQKPSYAGRGLVLIQRDGHKVMLDVGEPAVVGPGWGPAAPQIVLTEIRDGKHRFWLFDPKNPRPGQRRLLAEGWEYVSWAPDGSAILVARGQDAGLIDPEDPGQVVEVGRFPHPVWNGVWVAADG